MKRILIAVLALVFLEPTFANPSTVQDSGIRVSKPVACFSIKWIQEQIIQNREIPVFEDDNNMTEKKSIIMLFRNESSGSWSLIEFQDKFGCILGHGVLKLT
jgi:hypothetical protein